MLVSCREKAHLKFSTLKREDQPGALTWKVLARENGVRSPRAGIRTRDLPVSSRPTRLHAGASAPVAVRASYSRPRYRYATRGAPQRNLTRRFMSFLPRSARVEAGNPLEARLTRPNEEPGTGGRVPASRGLSSPSPAASGPPRGPPELCSRASRRGRARVARGGASPSQPLEPPQLRQLVC